MFVSTSFTMGTELLLLNPSKSQCSILFKIGSEFSASSSSTSLISLCWITFCQCQSNLLSMKFSISFLDLASLLYHILVRERITAKMFQGKSFDGVQCYLTSQLWPGTLPTSTLHTVNLTETFFLRTFNDVVHNDILLRGICSS